MVNITSLLSEIDRLATHQVFGKVAAVQGLLVEVSGVQNNLSVGDRCNVVARDGRIVPCEVVGFRNARALVMPFGALTAGALADLIGPRATLTLGGLCCVTAALILARNRHRLREQIRPIYEKLGIARR